MTPLEDMPKHIVSVPAKTLYRLMPLLAERSELSAFRHKLWGWRVEPFDGGGVLVIATNGNALGVIRDEKGRASAPVTILASEGLQKAVTPPPLHTVYYPGDYDELPLPDEFQPGTVIAYGVGVHVTQLASDIADASGEDAAGDGEERPMLYSEMAEDGNVWRGGYRMVEEYANWRHTFAQWTAPGRVDAYQMVGPEILSDFRNVHPDRSMLRLHFAEDEAHPVLVTSIEADDFVGLFMRGRKGSYAAPTIPDWLGVTPPLQPAA